MPTRRPFWWTGRPCRKRATRATSSRRTACSSTPTRRTCVPCARRFARTSVARRTPYPPSGRAATSIRWWRSAERGSEPGGDSRVSEDRASHEQDSKGREREDSEQMETRIPGATENLWDAGKAEGLSPLEALAYRSNLLGSDRGVANYGGGDTPPQARGRE